ncbi:protein tyrosine phosphatase domain-containing protein 1 isoform X2 [Cololabis saira]|uniref:protein tyrosine phosphatase domain-containing protein 1 isoform X2 n=1 Tax=Cololabis saira TaxID=129043 RepID=UPI002AD36CCB|nr:protein tyrosine phosphatase domain-containing protein 1 isoform X2 [Cololabis saira]
MAAAVTILTDLPYAMGDSQRGQINTETETANTRVAIPKYTKMGETLRHVIPGHMQCSMACGGKACKYENPSRWSEKEQAIKGLYSSWWGLKTVINLQRPGEHASCGNTLEQESGFTYQPETFMEAGIYYYNFGWKDYGVASLTTILDMVKVMSFAVQEGKMAVHCHAGLGRTGVLLACYLVFTSQMNADQAILFVRAKRPNSIQTRGQLLCVREFAQFLVPLRSVFSCADPKASAVTLSQYLIRQRHLLHGYEARQMKNVPKIVHLICKRLIDIASNTQVAIEEEWLEIPDLTAEVDNTVSHQALWQLGREMKGKGVPGLLCTLPTLNLPTQPSPSAYNPSLTSDSELDPLWSQTHFQKFPRFSLCITRCLSDSVLHHWQHLSANVESNNPVDCLIRPSLSHSSLAVCNTPSSCYLSSQDDVSSIQDIKTKPGEDNGSTFKKPQHKLHQEFTLELSEYEWKSLYNATLPVLSSKSKQVTDEEEPDPPAERCTNRGGVTDVPLITLQSELSSENRRLLVARALAMDLTDHQLSYKVSMWQTELNSGEESWERLRTETDPLVLSALMWSWLEQLKDPVISTHDINTFNPRNALNTMEKERRLTLLCILNCAAHLLPEPEEVVARFLTQIIKAFTKMDPASDQNESLFTTLRAVLTPVLYELHDKAVKGVNTSDPRHH